MVSVQLGLLILLAGGAVVLIAALNLNVSLGQDKQRARNLKARKPGDSSRDFQPVQRVDAILAETAAESGKVRPRETQDKRTERWLKYSGLPISPFQFRAISFGCIAALYLLILLAPRLNAIVRILIAVCGGRSLSHSYVNRRITRRFNAFDQDFAPFMLSLVGLLKTGMNIMSAIDAAAERLGPDSMFRLEVIRMLERLRFGVSEEHAIGAFAEGIDHPDIELFVQALLLSKQVGGSLSDTLERLARQARRRAQFRLQARAAVGQQRGSVWVIIVIIGLIQTMMYFQMPEVILSGFKSDAGFIVWQAAGLLCWFAIWLVGQLTRIRV